MFFRKRRHRESQTNLFLFLGILFTAALAIAVVILNKPALKKVFAPVLPGKPDFSIILPPGAVTGPDAVIEFTDGGRSYAAGYEYDSASYVGLVVWNSAAKRFALVHSLALASEAGRVLGAPALDIEILGPAAPASVVASAPTAIPALKAIFLIERLGNELRFAQRVDADGVERPAVFLLRGSPDTQFRFHDIDGDGFQEVVISTPVNGNDVSVYMRRDGRFVYDVKLSWALSTSLKLFPEPPLP